MPSAVRPSQPRVSVTAVLTHLSQLRVAAARSQRQGKKPQQITNVLTKVLELLRKHFAVLPHLHYVASAQLQCNKKKLVDCNQQDL